MTYPHGRNRRGRNRLTKDLLRNLLRELYTQYFRGEPQPAKRADQAATQREVAQWLHVQGAVAADPAIQPLEKVTTINAALLSKLDELGLREFFTEAHSNSTTAYLMAIVVNTDADTYHAGLRERVVTYLCKEVLGISPEDGSDAVQRTLNGVDKTLTLLRFGEIDTYKTQALLAFHLGWLACALGAPYRQLVTDMPGIETRLWEMISPYHTEQ